MESKKDILLKIAAELAFAVEGEDWQAAMKRGFIVWSESRELLFAKMFEEEKSA